MQINHLEHVEELKKHYYCYYYYYIITSDSEKTEINLWIHSSHWHIALLMGTVGYAAYMKLLSDGESQRSPPVSSNQLFWLKSTNATNEDKVWALKWGIPHLCNIFTLKKWLVTVEICTRSLMRCCAYSDF